MNTKKTGVGLIKFRRVKYKTINVYAKDYLWLSNIAADSNTTLCGVVSALIKKVRRDIPQQDISGIDHA